MSICRFQIYILPTVVTQRIPGFRMQHIMDMRMPRTRTQPKRTHTTITWHNTEVYLGYLNITVTVQGKYVEFC